MNKRELDVLRILFEEAEPLSSSQICELQKDLTQSTVIAVFRKLLNHELVEVCGQAHSGKVLTRLYRPTENAKTAILDYFAEIFLPFASVISPEELMNRIRE